MTFTTKQRPNMAMLSSDWFERTKQIRTSSETCSRKSISPFGRAARITKVDVLCERGSIGLRTILRPLMRFENVVLTQARGLDSMRSNWVGSRNPLPIPKIVSAISKR